MLEVGYYTAAEQTEPVFDPGLEVDCPVCSMPLAAEAIKTISAMPAAERICSCFFRVHKTCWEGIEDDEKGAFCALACDVAGF